MKKIRNNASQPLVSVIMNCYNGEKYLREAIDSVYAQSYKNWEIIFWDNASTDNSAEIVKSYDSQIKYTRGEKTISLGAARNKALEQCSGDYVAFLDCDDLWMEDRLKKQMELMLRKKDIIVCYSDSYKILLNKTKFKYSESWNYKFYCGEIFNNLIYTNFINWQTVLVNKRIAKESLFFNEKLKFAEDYDLLLKLSLKGRFDYIPHPLVYYRIHDNNMSRDVDLILHESLEIIKLYKDETKKRKIDIDKIIGSIYGSIVIILYRQNKKIKARHYMHLLKRYKSIKNTIIYFSLKYNLSFIFSDKLKIFYKKFN